MGDFIITVHISKGLSKRIDELYASSRSQEEILPELILAYRSSSKMRFVLENNPQKAKKLRKILSRDFYFRREH